MAGAWGEPPGEHLESLPCLLRIVRRAKSKGRAGREGARSAFGLGVLGVGLVQHRLDELGLGVVVARRVMGHR